MTDPIIGPPDGREVPRFAGPDTFARLPRLDQFDGVGIAIVGIPFDSGVSYRPGARFGPAAVRSGSKMLRAYHVPLDIEPWHVTQVADAGDIAVTPFSIAEAITTIESDAKQLLAKATYVIAIGGDHTIALPLIRSVASKHGPLALVHFDAHLDTWDTYFGEPYTHGTPFRRAVEEGLLDLDCSAHVGIRSPLFGRQDLVDDKHLGFEIVTTADVATTGISAAMERVRARVGPRPVYISVDVDVLDPAHAPGTGTPEPGGLSSRELQLMIRMMDGMNIVGADVVEVAPAYDHAELTALAAANISYELLALFAKRIIGRAATTRAASTSS